MMFSKSQLTPMSEVQSAAEAAGVQLDEPTPQHSDNICKEAYDRDGEHAEMVWNLQDMSDLSAGCVSTVQHIQSLCEKAVIDIPSAVREGLKLIAQSLAAIHEYSVCLLPLLLYMMLSSLRKKHY